MRRREKGNRIERRVIKMEGCEEIQKKKMEEIRKRVEILKKFEGMRDRDLFEKIHGEELD